MPLRVDVQPRLLEWALTRSRRREKVEARFDQLPAWLSGEKRPTLKQLESFASATRTAVGYLFLPEPPDEPMPIEDFRTVGSAGLASMSPDLLDTIYLCQRRQAWYEEHAQTVGIDPVAFVGKATVKDDPAETARRIAKTIGFTAAERETAKNWEVAFRLMVERVEQAGVLVMVSGVVGSNTHRPLDPEEFRGFALADAMAPLIFVNGADTKAGQMFTLAHELAHLWLGESGVSDAGAGTFSTRRIERWCNAVAAEVLVPLDDLLKGTGEGDPLASVDRLRRRFKVSSLVILRRLHDAGRLKRAAFEAAYSAEQRLLVARAKARRTDGGDYYNTQPVRLSRRLTRAVIASTYEGHTLFTEAFDLLSVKKEQTLRELGHRLEVLG
ncbi:MAG: ImmA/IrrE family metallo-endopeptidase [Planctomycetota bacterium]